MLLAHDIARGLSPVSILDEAGIPLFRWQRRVLDHWHEDQHILCSRHAGKSTLGAAMGLHVAMYHPGHPVVMVGRAGRQSVALPEGYRSQINDDQPPGAEAEVAISGG